MVVVTLEYSYAKYEKGIFSIVGTVKNRGFIVSMNRIDFITLIMDSKTLALNANDSQLYYQTDATDLGPCRSLRPGE